MEEKTRRKEKEKTRVSQAQLITYRELLTGDNPSLRSNYGLLADAISENFNVEVIERDLLIVEEPTIKEMEEDLRLIYKHCVK